jgi:hypothetical protein
MNIANEKQIQCEGKCNKNFWIHNKSISMLKYENKYVSSKKRKCPLILDEICFFFVFYFLFLVKKNWT